MRLEKHQIPAMLIASINVTCFEEVVVADFKQICRAGIAGDVSAQLPIRRVGFGDHRQRVPAHQGTELLLNRQIAGEARLLADVNAVDIRRGELGLPAHTLLARQRDQAVENLPCAHRALGRNQGGEGIAPLLSFLGVGVFRRHWQRIRQRERLGEGKGDGVGCVHAHTVNVLRKNVVLIVIALFVDKQHNRCTTRRRYRSHIVTHTLSYAFRTTTIKGA